MDSAVALMALVPQKEIIYLERSPKETVGPARGQGDPSAGPKAVLSPPCA